MAASLTLSSPVIAADGKTMTATISGGTGTGYAITNATGISPHLTSGNAYGLKVSSVSVLGSTLTINLTTPAGVGEAFRLDIATTSNLTDSGANTPTGQTNITATNNSAVVVTTVLVGTSPGVFELSGMFTTGTSSGQAYIRGGTAFGSNTIIDSPIQFVADATEVATLSSNGANSAVAIDTATSFTTITGGGGSWSAKAATTAPLAAGKHLFRVNMDLSEYFYGVRLSGGARTMHAVATAKQAMRPNTSAYLNLPANANATLTGTWRPGTNPNNGMADVGGNYTGLAFDVGFTGTGLDIATVLATYSAWSASIDGAAAGPYHEIPSSTLHNQQGLLRLAKGLSDTVHTISATFISSGVNTLAYWLRVINGTATTVASAVGATSLSVASVAHLAVGDWVWIDDYENREWRQITAITGTGPYMITVAALANAHAIGARVTSYSAPAGSFFTAVRKDLSAKRLVAMGDSNTQGANELGSSGTPDAQGNYYSTYDPRHSPMFKAADPLSMEVVNLGIQGTTSTQMADRSADFASYGKSSYDRVTIWAGTNDINGTSTTPATYKSKVEAMVAAADDHLRPAGRILLLPPLTPSTTNAGGLNITTAASALAEVAATNPATCTFIPVATLSAGLVPSDYSGLHYTMSGLEKIAANLTPYLTDAVPLAIGGVVGFVK